MDIKDYRRQIDTEIARNRMSAADPRWNSVGLESASGLERVGIASRGDDSGRLRAVLADRDTESEVRAAALAELVEQKTDQETLHEEALDRLGDADESPEVRLTALDILKVAAFASPTAADWQPDYREALRTATRADDEDLRYAAFAALAAMKDRTAQDDLLQGLTDPEQARVRPADALRLLAADPHSGARDIAQTLADDRSDPEVRFEALRALASDPGSAGRFRSLFLDSRESAEVRKLSATALYSLDPASLREIVAGMEAEAETRILTRSAEALRSATTPTVNSDHQAFLHAAALVKPVR